MPTAEESKAPNSAECSRPEVSGHSSPPLFINLPFLDKIIRGNIVVEVVTSIGGANILLHDVDR